MKTNRNYYMTSDSVCIDDVASKYCLGDKAILNGYRAGNPGGPGGDDEQNAQIRITALSRIGSRCVELEIYKDIGGSVGGECNKARIQAAADAMARQVSSILKAKGVSVVDCITGETRYL
jgi:hypothetical protein